MDFDGIVAGWDIEEKEKIAKKERKCATPRPDVRERTFSPRNAHQFLKIASNEPICIKYIKSHRMAIFASNGTLMHNKPMRTTITLDDDVHEFAQYYASAKGITLSAAMNELVRKAETAPAAEPEHFEFERSPNGLPLLPRTGRTITCEMVKELSEDEYDPKKFT